MCENIYLLCAIFLRSRLGDVRLKKFQELISE